MVDLELAALTGQVDTHLCSAPEAESLGARVHADVVAPFLDLKARALGEGFDLAIDSGFRDFNRQLSIWNRKATGQLAVLDSEARPLDISRLTERELVFAILRWSALPGASRHHWGTDLDVYDRAAKPEGYQVALIPDEVRPGGMFGPLHHWLDRQIEKGEAQGFFRPYDLDRGGIAPERWHLSHGPTAIEFQRHLTADRLRSAIVGQGLALEGVVLANLEEIVQRFVLNINSSYS